MDAIIASDTEACCASKTTRLPPPRCAAARDLGPASLERPQPGSRHSSTRRMRTRSPVPSTQRATSQMTAFGCFPEASTPWSRRPSWRHSRAITLTSLIPRTYPFVRTSRPSTRCLRAPSATPVRLKEIPSSTTATSTRRASCCNGSTGR